MKYLNKIFILTAFCSGIWSCSEDENSLETLFTVDDVMSENLGQEEIYLITDNTGIILDSATLTTSNIVELKGPIDTKEFNLTYIRKKENQLLILVYLNVQSNNWNRLINTNAYPQIKLTIGEEFNANGKYDLFVSGKSSWNTNVGSQHPFETFALYNDFKIISGVRENSDIPKYHLYSNIPNDSQLTISLEDFTDEMIPHSVTSNDFEWSIRLSGKESKSSEYSHYLSHYKNHSDNSFYYPPGIFQYYISQFNTNGVIKNTVYSSTYYGNLPSQVEKLDIGELNISNNIENYTATSSNSAIDMVETVFYDSNYIVSIVGPNKKDLNVLGLITTIREMFPNHNTSFNQVRSTTFTEFEKYDYTSYLDDYFNKSSDFSVVKEYSIYNYE